MVKKRKGSGSEPQFKRQRNAKTDDAAAKGICFNYSRGNGYCKFGDSCKFKHEGLKGGSGGSKKKAALVVQKGSKKKRPFDRKKKKGNKEVASMIVKDLRDMFKEDHSGASDEEDNTLFNLVRGGKPKLSPKVGLCVTCVEGGYDYYVPRRHVTLMVTDANDDQSGEDFIPRRSPTPIPLSPDSMARAIEEARLEDIRLKASIVSLKREIEELEMKKRIEESKDGLGDCTSSETSSDSSGSNDKQESSSTRTVVMGSAAQTKRKRSKKRRTNQKRGVSKKGLSGLFSSDSEVSDEPIIREPAPPKMCAGAVWRNNPPTRGGPKGRIGRCQARRDKYRYQRLGIPFPYAKPGSKESELFYDDDDEPVCPTEELRRDQAARAEWVERRKLSNAHALGRSWMGDAFTGEVWTIADYEENRLESETRRRPHSKAPIRPIAPKAIDPNLWKTDSSSSSDGKEEISRSPPKKVPRRDDRKFG
jgi:hypothetical protein